MRTIARRVVNARKCVNQREGWTALEDTLPARFLGESPSDTGATLSRSRLETMVAAYYHDRGWTEDGRVPDHLRRSLLVEISSHHLHRRRPGRHPSD